MAPILLLPAGFPRFPWILLVLVTLNVSCSSFNLFQKSSRGSQPFHVMPLSEEDTEEASPAPLLDWNASGSGSIGSLLMQMQKKEEELRKLNKTLLDKEQALDLSSYDNNATTLTREEMKEEEWSTPSSYPDPNPMDYEMAKELDESVTVRLSSSIGNDVQRLALPSLYKILLAGPDQEAPSVDLPPLSKPDHYHERIGREMRHLSVSIASCIDDPVEWRLFCQQLQPSGGLLPLITCIREGAKLVREQQQGNDLWDEERFLAACSACRALRDLCALSLDLAAVITDGVLRANVAYDGSLVDDLCALLKYASDYTDIAPRRRRFQWRRKKQSNIWPRRNLKEARLQCKLYVTQLLLALVCASDGAVDALRSTEGLTKVLLKCSSYDRKGQTRRWLRYPVEMVKSAWRSRRKSRSFTEQYRRPFIEAAAPPNDFNGRVQGTANQVLAAIGYNQWVPKIPGQKGLRILCLDGGGSRGMTSVVALNSLVESLGGVEVADCFDLVVGTSTGAIIAFLVGMRRETSEQAVKRYDVLIEKIFTKSALSTPLLLFTTATYDETPFMKVLSEILGDYTMLDSRADPSVPFVFGVTSKMSSTPTHVALFRNYNYNRGELPDPFIIRREEARESLGLTMEMEDDLIRKNDYMGNVDNAGEKPTDGSRHPGSFRVLQRYALRASTAAPTVFKPVMMGGEMYCDGGIVASNPTAIAIHEARNIWPDVPIELVVSLGTGGFLEQKSAPRIGWDGIIGQIVDSATDGEQIHHILEDILGDGSTARLGRSSISNTQYMRFNPIVGLPDEFPIDVTDPEKLLRLKKIAREYMKEPEQKRKLRILADLLQGRRGFLKRLTK